MMRTRDYNSLEIDTADGSGIITKRSTDNEKLRLEIAYYNNIPDKLKIYFPRVFATQDNSLQLEYYDYPDLGCIYTNTGSVTIDQVNWKSILIKLFTLVSQTFKNESNVSDWAIRSASAYDMYLDKTKTHVNQFYNELKHTDAELFTSDELVINGMLYDNLHKLWPQIREYIRMSLVTTVEWGFIHGDLCFGNILYSESGIIRLVDPRGSFGFIGNYGDIRYDVAKLWHSIYGRFDYLNHDKFVLEKHTSIEYSLHFPQVPNKVYDIEKLFEVIFFEKFNRQEIDVITGLLFVSAASRHYESRKRQIALYLTGIKLLNQSFGGLTTMGNSVII